jgi:hypothetical protein
VAAGGAGEDEAPNIFIGAAKKTRRMRRYCVTNATSDDHVLCCTVCDCINAPSLIYVFLE